MPQIGRFKHLLGIKKAFRSTTKGFFYAQILRGMKSSEGVIQRRGDFESPRRC